MNNANSQHTYKGPPQWFLPILCISGAFITYCSMYAFRKPFTAGTYSNLELWGVDYKIILITTQVIGYMLSKFIGIKVVSEMQTKRRIFTILVLIGIAWLSLLVFGLVPYPYNFICLFFNGLPLGMIWGIVFSFLEGRSNTELLGAGMSASFIVASGLVKSIGKYLVDNWAINEFWMPFYVGLLFIPPLLMGVWILSKIPPPSKEDTIKRTQRVPMNGRERKAFFKEFALGIILVVFIYIALTIFRDLRDNFAVEIWASLGFADSSNVLLTAEIPIAIAVFAIVAMMIFIQNNRKAFYININMIMFGGALLMFTTLMFENGFLGPAVWMVLVGFAMYLSYISYHTMLFERWIALFRYPSNIGFLMYIADAFGYLGSVVILFVKNFGSKEVDWLEYIIKASYIIGGLTVIISLIVYAYFFHKEKQQVSVQAVEV